MTSRRPAVLSIAGSDSSGGAGIQADLAAIAANGGYGATAITALTAQSTTGVRAVSTVEPSFLLDQMAAVFEDLDVRAVKTGMLANAGLAEAIGDGLQRWPAPLILDPVMVATSGAQLIDDEAVSVVVERLLPRALLVTPNRVEAERLSGTEVSDLESAKAAGRLILELGAPAVLVKGGHLDGELCIDLLIEPNATTEISGPRVDTRHTHGTGCALSSAIATWIARGADLETACRRARRFLEQALTHALPVGRGAGPPRHFFFMDDASRAAAWVEEIES